MKTLKPQLTNLFFLLKELAEQLKAQLKEANKFKETITQIPAKRSGVEVSNKRFCDNVYYYLILLLL